MSIANCKLDESTKLEFGVSITGADGLPSARFVIEGKDFSISYPCKQINEGVEVDIGHLKNILPAGTYPVKLEIVLENKIYVPLQDTITFEPFVEVLTKPKAVVSVKESVKIDRVVVNKVQTNEEIIKQLQVANMIANTLSYNPSTSQNAREIIDESLRSQKTITVERLELLNKMLNLAESVHIKFDRQLTPEVRSK